jgi:hypothetical protein
VIAAAAATFDADYAGRPAVRALTGTAVSAPRGICGIVVVGRRDAAKIDKKRLATLTKLRRVAKAC